MTQVVFTGWIAPFDKVSTNKALRTHADMSLNQAKASIDQILDGETVIVRVSTNSIAEILVSKVRDLGAICRIVQDDEVKHPSHIQE